MIISNVKVEAGQRALPGRLRQTAEAYATTSRSDGGWGLALHQASSLVNTAEVLTIVEAGGLEYDHPCVEGGLGYLAKELGPHLAHPDRGPRTRYTAFALLGLTEFPQAFARDDVRRCAEFAVEWLVHNNRVDGGWSSDGGQKELSLFATCTAIGALARIAPENPAIQEGADCLIANCLSPATWPIAANRREHPSPAITGLAALALANAGRERQAKPAMRWLAQRPELWAKRIEEARDELGTPWRHMTFSICARAVLRGGMPIFDPRLRPTLRYVDSLWSRRDGLWSDGTPDGHLTVRGAYATALLYQELRRSFLALDPLSLAEALEPDNVPVVDSNLTDLELNGEGAVMLKSTEANPPHPIELGEQFYEIVEIVHTSGPIDAKTLGRRLKTKPPDMRTMVNELNAIVLEQTNGAVQQLIHRAPRKGFLIPIKGNRGR